jgi:hypothetical protein
MKPFTTQIETERLILRPHTMDDVEPSYQMNLDEDVSGGWAGGDAVCEV